MHRFGIFSRRGKNVLLMMDSLTRLCHGQRADRSFGTRAAGDDGIPPQRLCAAPGDSRARRKNCPRIDHRLLHRAGGRGRCQRADFRRGEGHFRRAFVAEPGMQPTASISPRSMCCRASSRVRSDVTDAEQQKACRRVLALTAVYTDIEDLVNIGAYVPGASLEYDVAVQARPKIVEFLRQEAFSPMAMDKSRRQASGELANWSEAGEDPAHAVGQGRVEREIGSGHGEISVSSRRASAASQEPGAAKAARSGGDRRRDAPRPSEEELGLLNGTDGINARRPAEQHA